MFNRRDVSTTSSWNRRDASTGVSSFDRVDAGTTEFGDSDITTTSGSPFYLVEEGTDDKILTEDLYQILLGYLGNWKEINTKISTWVRRNFTES
jgi:hypothetical protein